MHPVAKLVGQGQNVTSPAGEVEQDVGMVVGGNRMSERAAALVTGQGGVDPPRLEELLGQFLQTG